MFLDVEIKLKKKNKILFSRDSQFLQELIKLIQLQNHRILVMWALDCGKMTLEQFEVKYSNECRPRTCLELSEDWADFLLDDTRPNKERLLSEKCFMTTRYCVTMVNKCKYGGEIIWQFLLFSLLAGF